MAVYKPKSHGQQSKFYVCEFVYQGKRFREPTGATSKTVAVEYEKQRKRGLERAAAGLPTDAKAARIRTVKETVAAYLEDYKLTHRPKSVRFSTQRLAHVVRFFGNDVLSDLTETRMYDYIRLRKREKASGSAVNGELGEFSRALGQPWRTLWPRVRRLEERHDTGKALSADEQQRLLEALRHDETPHMRTLVPLLLLTGMRSGEALELTWQQLDLVAGLLTVGKAKTEAGRGRVIPVNRELAPVLAAHRAEFVANFGEPQPEWFVFAFGSPIPNDPTRPTGDPKHAWQSLRKRANVKCRLHDLRHTYATQLAEAGTPEETMKALMGHMSKRMLERYSHIRMQAKREAAAVVRLYPRNSEGVPLKVPLPTELEKVN